MKLPSYPVLSISEQLKLPVLTQVPQLLPSKFEDSTHQLWRCDTELGKLVLKICNHQALPNSVFWLGMNDLFACDFPNSLGEMASTYQFVSEHSPLIIPECIASRAKQFVLARFVKGQDVVPAMIDEQMVISLADHIAAIHKQTSASWGKFGQPEFNPEEWSSKLFSTLMALTEKSTLNIDETVLQQALAQTAEMSVFTFTPVMLDLRWDQLRVLDSGELALIDLDAFCIGPRELELVLLEYLLTEQQHQIFVGRYRRQIDYPDLSNCRLSYQLLLFLMNVLGETDLEAWLQNTIK